MTSESGTVASWTIKHYSELELHELYAILNLRSQVFVVEQGSRFLDPDNLDQYAHHVMAWKGSELIATARLFGMNVCYEGYQAIGRVACTESCRGQGVGKELMERSIAECARLFGAHQQIKITAQLRLKRFYEQFGFQQRGDPYAISVIDHIAMIR